MKKLFIIFLSVLTLTALAQQKQVAVYVIGDNAGENRVLESRLVQAIGRSNEYTAVERTKVFRVIRGGSFYTTNKYCTVSHRGYTLPDDRDQGVGFRVVCIP